MTALDRRQMAQTLVLAALVVAAIFAAGYAAAPPVCRRKHA